MSTPRKPPPPPPRPPRPATASSGKPILETDAPEALPASMEVHLPSAAPLGPASSRLLPDMRESSATMPQLVEHIALPRLTVLIERDGGAAVHRTVTHDGDECRIGTHPSNDVVLTDRAVSRFHCKIHRDGAVWRIVDSASRNGTRLDGVRVRDAELAPTGGTLAFGSSVLRLSASEGGQVELPVTPSFGQLIGASIAMRKLFALLERVANSDINVLIQGESGTGKELVATEIVRRGPRANRPFIIVDCGAISPHLIESELFGHVRGAFTGAERDRIGAFEAANTGTVFLDEIGELPLELQPKLLRALEAREVRRVGETKPRKIDVRVVSATNRELDREVNKGRFREDLYFRLAVVGVRVPSLRERMEDLLLLIRGFLVQLGMPEEERLFGREVLAEMGRHDWPGNVRELRNYVERAIVLKGALHEIGEPASRDHEPASQKPRAPFRVAKEEAIDDFERVYLTALLDEAAGNMSKAARLAAMDRMYLHKLVQKHGLRSSNSPPSGGIPGPSGLGDF